MQPRKLGRYEILEELGRGAMGQVLLAYDPQIDRKVAIKIVRGFEPSSEDARQRFLQEARAAGKLLHPGIVTLFDVGETDGLLYLAMEYVVGETLDTHCTPDSLLPVPTVLAMVARVAAALHYAHGMGIVHRDIKPANLMRTGAETVKIMDFGLARGAEAGLTREGALLGSPSYMSPEQIRGEPVDGRSDLFSVAVVLHELVSGQKPFRGDSVSSIIYRIVNEEPQVPQEITARGGPRVEALLRRGLAKDPDRRFQTGEEFARALREAAAVESAARAGAEVEADPTASGEIRPTSRSSPRRSSPLPFIVGIVAVLAALGGAAYYFRDELGWFRSEPPPPILYETAVRTQPPEADLRIDGEPLDAAAAGAVSFSSEGPFSVLTAEYRCRRQEHRLSPADHGGEIALVLEPVEISYPLAPSATTATVVLNGAEVGATPLDLPLDLCRANEVSLQADGYRELTLTIPEGATPLEARTLLGSIELLPIPKGTLRLPTAAVNLVYYLDGERLGTGAHELELPEGPHRVRARNDTYWIDVTATIDVVAGEAVTADLSIPPLTTLVVLAYPPNCRVDLRRPGGSWKYLDDVPLRRKLAVGDYEVRVTLKPTGESRTRTVRLAAGQNPDIRVSFGDRS